MSRTRSTVTSVLVVGVLLVSVLFVGGCSKSTESATDDNATTGSQKAIPAEKNPPGDIPDTQAFVPYTTTGGVSLKVLEGWARTVSSNSAEFTDKLNTIRVTWEQTSTPTTAASVAITDVAKLMASEPAFQLVSINSVKLPAGTSVRMIYRVNGTANDVTGKRYRMDVERYTVFKNGKRVDLTLISPVGADNVDAWRTVSRSLAWK